MDTVTLTSIIVAIVAIIPGVWAIIAQLMKDRANFNENLERLAFNLSSSLMEEVQKLQIRTDGLEEQNVYREKRVEDLMSGDKMFEKLYEKPVIVRCDHCRSPNVISNITCTQCGAPLK